jgi:hypothetical protein
VPTGLPLLPIPGGDKIVQGTRVPANTVFIEDLFSPDLSMAIQSFGQPLAGVPGNGKAVLGTLFFTNGNGVRERVQVALFQDPVIDQLIDVQVRREIRIDSKLGTQKVKIQVGGSSATPLEFLMKVIAKPHKQPPGNGHKGLGFAGGFGQGY